jgi:hypothetical protein
MAWQAMGELKMNQLHVCGGVLQQCLQCAEALVAVAAAAGMLRTPAATRLKMRSDPTATQASTHG